MKRLTLLIQLLGLMGLIACGGPRDPARTQSGLVFELKKEGVTLSRCRGGSSERLFLDKSVASKVLSKNFKERVTLKIELGSYSCLAIGSQVQMISPGFSTTSGDRLQVDKIQVVYRNKINRYQLKAAGFDSWSHLNTYLEGEAEAQKRRGRSIFNTNLVTLTYFTYVGDSVGSQSRDGGFSSRAIRPIKLTKEGQRLFSCDKSKPDWTDIWLNKDFSSRKCDIQTGDISLHMAAGGYSCQRVGNEVLLTAAKEVELGRAVVTGIEVLKWADLTQDQIFHSGLNQEQLQFIKAKAEEEKNDGFVTLTYFEFQKEEETLEVTTWTTDQKGQSFPSCSVEELVDQLKEHPADIASHVAHGGGWVFLPEATCAFVGSEVELISNDPQQTSVKGSGFFVKSLMKVPFHLLDETFAKKAGMVVDQLRQSLVAEFGKNVQCSSFYLVEIERP